MSFNPPSLLHLDFGGHIPPGGTGRNDPAHAIRSAHPGYPPQQVARAIHALTRHGVRSLWDSAQRPDDDLLRATDLGTRGLATIREITFKELVKASVRR